MKARKLWNFYRPLVLLFATILYTFAFSLHSWLEWPLAIAILVMFLEVFNEVVVPAIRWARRQWR